MQWLVALADEAVIDVSFAGVRSGRESRGHRFLAPGAIAIKSALSYQAELRAAHVIADRKERQDLMMERVLAAAKKLGGVADPDPSLVSENASLVEEPHVVIGSFDEAFLTLPPAVIRAVARGHQKYFCLSQGEGDSLLPHYLAVANTATHPDNVARGNDGVMRARLSDARFFFDEDRKQAQEVRIEKLAGIVFHNRLGTVKDKVARMAKLGQRLGASLGLTEEAIGQVRRATELAKNDLVSLMVGEFPELQGVMGRAYAEHAGEVDVVCDAIRDHYAPIGADGPIAPTDVSRVVALSDRIDTLVGCFAIGLQPTGTADPYALRRATIGVLRTILEANDVRYANLDLLVAYAHAYEALEGRKLDASELETVTKLAEFSTERLRGLLEQRTSRAAADAVLAGQAFVSGKHLLVIAHPAYALAKARALDAQLTQKAAWRPVGLPAERRDRVRARGVVVEVDMPGNRRRVGGCRRHRRNGQHGSGREQAERDRDPPPGDHRCLAPNGRASAADLGPAIRARRPFRILNVPPLSSAAELLALTQSRRKPACYGQSASESAVKRKFQSELPAGGPLQKPGQAGMSLVAASGDSHGQAPGRSQQRVETNDARSCHLSRYCVHCARQLPAGSGLPGDFSSMPYPHYGSKRAAEWSSQMQSHATRSAEMKSSREPRCRRMECRHSRHRDLRALL